MVETELREPHDSHVTKKRRFSLPSRVSDDLQILHVTYSTVLSALVFLELRFARIVDIPMVSTEFLKILKSLYEEQPSEGTAK